MATYQSPRVATSTNKLTATTARSCLNEIWDYAVFDLATDGAGALALNDVIQMIKIPKRATIIDLILTTTDLDTNGSPLITLDVGDGGDTDRFIDGSTIGRTAGVSRLDAQAGHLYEYTADDTIDVLVQAGPATGAATGSVRLAVCFSMAELV